MIFIPTSLAGAFIVEPEPLRDERGFFARTWDQRELEARGLNSKIVQCSVSFSERRGTLRGMHYQTPPHEEAKLVRCVRGVLHDVIIDLRSDSATFRRHFSTVLRAGDYRALYVPEGVAHGFLTLEDGTEALYQISEAHRPEAARGVRWDDPAFGIRWPEAVRVISEPDRSYPDYAR